MLPDLRARGRGDLAGAIERKLAETRQVTRWFDDDGLKGRLRVLDRRLLGGVLLDASRAIRRAGASFRRLAPPVEVEPPAMEIDADR